MKAVILNGAGGSGDASDRVAARLETRLIDRGAAPRHYLLRDLSIGHCLGDLDCWIRTPGRCRIRDAGQEIERAVHDADLLVLVTPVTFGGYSATLKRAMDRLIPLILPFFVKTADMTHHAHRYVRLPRIAGIGVDDEADARRTHLFKAFVESNALNLGSPGWAGVVLGADETTWDAGLSLVLQPGPAPGNASGSAVGARDALHAALAATPLTQPMATRPRVALLQTSGRPAGESTSHAIAAYLAGRFATLGSEAEIVPATAFARGGDTAAAATETIARADVLAVISPLYVDTLPALAILALEQTRTLRQAECAPQRVIGVINCGFPEPEQTRFAFASLRDFSRQVGAHYAGGISVGGGESIHGRDLVEAGGQVRWLRAALDTAAEALSQGGAIPVETSLGTAKAAMPPMLYRFAGFMQWTLKGRSHGLGHGDLVAAPFDEISDAAWEREAASGPARARPLRVVGKRLETDDAVTLLFEDPARDPLVYRAGQFITLELMIADERVRRSYSLASAPKEPGLAITVKRVPGGLVSNALHDRVHVGDILRTHGPSGRFLPDDTARKLLMFAGGSGIVPLAAIARDRLRASPGSEIVLVYGASTKQRAIFADALDALAAAETERFTLHWVLDPADDAWTGLRGRLDEPGIGHLLDILNVRTFGQAMICGPDPMRESVRALLAARGLSPERIAEESFTSPRAAGSSTRPEAATLVGVGGKDLVFTVLPGQTLLDAALDAGAALSFSCMTGSCGACRIRVIEGLDAIELDAPNDVSMADRAAGLVPACICRPGGPVRFAAD